MIDCFHRIVVGTPKEKLNFEFQVVQFCFNPTWTIPPTIIKEDLTRKHQKPEIIFHQETTIYNSQKEKKLVRMNGIS